MSMTLYFSKTSLNSHIFEVYDNPSDMRDILNTLHISLKDGVSFFKEGERYKENGEFYLYDVVYKFGLIEKLGVEFDNAIVGTIIKTSTLFVNKIDNDTGEIKKIPVPNSEIIKFYFNVYKEIVVFHTTNRFGYIDFNLAFEQLINICMETNGYDYKFEVALLREGLNIDLIETELSKIGRIESLKIEIIPPNPDDELLDQIHKNGEEYLESIKDAKVTSRSILFTSKAPEGLNLTSKIVKDEIAKIDRIHSRLSSDEALNKGYANVEAVSKEGRIFSTKDNNPIKDSIDGNIDNIVEFAISCKKKLQSLFSFF